MDSMSEKDVKRRSEESLPRNNAFRANLNKTFGDLFGPGDCRSRKACKRK
jgi:hypothetical protein